MRNIFFSHTSKSFDTVLFQKFWILTNVRCFQYDLRAVFTSYSGPITSFPITRKINAISTRTSHQNTGHRPSILIAERGIILKSFQKFCPRMEHEIKFLNFNCCQTFSIQPSHCFHILFWLHHQFPITRKINAISTRRLHRNAGHRPSILIVERGIILKKFLAPYGTPYIVYVRSKHYF